MLDKKASEAVRNDRRALPFSGRERRVGDQHTPMLTQFNQLIIFFLLLIGLLPGLLGLIGIFKTSKRELIETKGTNFMKVASFTAFQVEKIVEEKLEAIKRLSSLPTVLNVLTFSEENSIMEIRNLRKIIMPELAARFFIANIYNAKSEIVFSSRPTTEKGAVLAADPKLIAKVLKEGKILVSDIMIDDNAANYSIDIYAPIKNDNGDNAGVLATRHEVNGLFETIINVRIGKTGHANLVTSAGYIVVCPIYPPRSHHLSDELMGTISKKRAGWTITADDGHGSTNSIIGFSPVNFNVENLSPESFGNKKWYIFTRQEPSETFQSIRKFKNSAIGYAALVVIMVIGIGVYAWREILKAQKALQAEVVYMERAESIKQLMLSFQRLIVDPFERFERWLDEMKNDPFSSKSSQNRIDRMKSHLQKVNSVLKHFEYYTQADTFKPQKMDITKVVGETLYLLDYMIDSEQMDVNFSRPEEPLILMGQPKLLNIVFMNILLNAIQAVEKQGAINVSVKRNNGWCICKVSDNGAGIPESEIDSIFDPFYTTKKGHKGYGMGLAVSRGIIKKHNGTITVSSSEDEGTEVSVKLKLVDNIE
ncbi:MAG TPA: sensor histidine kinase [Nitrospirae bacterium]|nr:sensor histidine kinase [Nitrospirota bacterium]